MANALMRNARHVVACVVLPGVALAFAPHAHAQLICEETAKLIASDGATGDTFGTWVSVDGDVAVIGALGDDDNGTDAGAAYVYRFNGTTWEQEQKLLAWDGAAGDWFGQSVSVSGDVIVVGAVYADALGVDSGSGYVFVFDGATWEPDQKLLASDGAAGDRLGGVAALSDDVIAIAAGGDDDNGADSGSVYVFRFDPNGSTWEEEHKLVPSDGAGEDRFGALSVQGDVVVVGARLHDANGTDSGAAWVFRFDGTGWDEEQKLLPSGGAAGDWFGHRVSVSGDALVVGAPIDDNRLGAAYVYRFNGLTWYEEQKFLASDGADLDNFGWCVAIDDDLVVVSANADDDWGESSGSAYVYRYGGASWDEQQKLLASDGATADEFGFCVALDGGTALSGAKAKDGFTGAAYVFDVHGPCPETVCPDDPNDYLVRFGGAVFRDALAMCPSDDVRFEVLQSSRFTPLMPFVQLEYWAHTALTDSPLASVEYTIEGHVSALVAGGQNADTLRTYVLNYAVGQFELIDERGTSANTDEIITYAQTANAEDYVHASDGEIRVRQEVFDPGLVISANWALKVDSYEVTVTP